MEITYKDAVDGFTSFIQNKDYEKDLSVVTAEPLKAPDALASVEMLDDMNNYTHKVEFVQLMLSGNGVTVKHKDTTLVSFQVTEGMALKDVEFFSKRPGVFRFVVDALFGVFLKNSYPLSSESQKAEE